jgi:sugar-specific transcriptional regulator TrmB
MDYKLIQNVQIINNEQDFIDAAIELIKQARYTVRIRSAVLDSTLFNKDGIRDALSAFVRQTRDAELRVLIDRPDVLLQRDHRLLSLMRKLSDKVHFRQYHDIADDERDSFIITDEQGILIKPVSPEAVGYFSLNDKAITKQAVQRFDSEWHLSPIARQLRELNI